MANPFGLLGLDPQTATIADVEHAYRRLALKRHPEKNLDRPEEAQMDFVELERAKEQAIHMLESGHGVKTTFASTNKQPADSRSFPKQHAKPDPFFWPNFSPTPHYHTNFNFEAGFKFPTPSQCTSAPFGSEIGSRRRQKPANSKLSTNQRPRTRPNYGPNFAFEPTDFTYRTSSQARSTPPQGESGRRKQEESSFLRQLSQAEDDAIDMALSISNIERLITRTSSLSSSRRSFVVVHSAQRLRESIHKEPWRAAHALLLDWSRSSLQCSLA